MQFLLDTHVHSLASGHAYSTIQENATAARLAGLKLFCLTDHGPAFPGASHSFYFHNLHALPDYIEGVRVVQGTEANITDYDGSLDIDPADAARLEFIIASLHTPCLASGSVEENTRALVSALKNPFVDGIGHPGDPKFPINPKIVAQAAKKYGKHLELNERYTQYQEPPGNLFTQLAEHCIRLEVPLMCASDAHFSSCIGQFDNLSHFITTVGIPEHLILNTSLGRMDALLQARIERLRGRKRKSCGKNKSLPQSPSYQQGCSDACQAYQLFFGGDIDAIAVPAEEDIHMAFEDSGEKDFSQFRAAYIRGWEESLRLRKRNC